MVSDAPWVMSFKCVVKGYQDCRFDAKEGEAYQSHCPQSRTFDIGDSYMRVASLRLLGVTKIQDGDSSKKRIATTKTFY